MIYSRTAFVLLLFTGIGLLSHGQISQDNKRAISPTLVPLSGLKFADIGNIALRGSFTLNNDDIQMKAGGSDIWGRHDEFYFGYKRLKGDFDIRVQLISLSAAHKYTKAGIMARADLSDSSQHVYYQAFPDNSARNRNNGGCEFQYREISGGEMKAIYPDPGTAGRQFDVTFPQTWLRMSRQGNIFKAYISSDNKSWKLYSSFTLKMPQYLFVGLAVTSHNKSEYTTAQFKAPQIVKKEVRSGRK